MGQFEDVSFSYRDSEKTVSVARARLPVGWSTNAWRTEAYQSWDRPFKLEVEATANQDGTGPRLLANTGDAFSYFELTDMATAMGFNDPFGGLFGGFAMPGISYPSPMNLTVPKPHTGRPERPFTSFSDYLDSLIVAMDDGFLARQQIWLWGECVIGEEPNEAAAREQQLAQIEDRRWREADISGFNFRVNAVIDRTMARHWTVVNAQGQYLHIIIGAKIHGLDKLCYKSGYAPSTMLGYAPFGQAGLGYAYLYDTEWIVEKKFYGIMLDGQCDPDWFRAATVTFGGSLSFDDALMNQMNKEYKRLADQDRAERQKANEEFHRYNQQLKERLDAEDVARQQRMKQHEEQLKRDRERRQAEDRKREADRRVRDAWSEAIRGTEKYEDPYGNMIEKRVSAPGQRAFYDHSTGETVMSDVSDVDKPSDWEELSSWR